MIHPLEKRPNTLIALGDSREPPVATFFRRMERWNEDRQVVGMRAKAAPLQALETNTPRQLAYRFDDEFEDEKILADLIDVQPQLHKGRMPLSGQQLASSQRRARGKPGAQNSNARLEPTIAMARI